MKSLFQRAFEEKVAFSERSKIQIGFFKWKIYLKANITSANDTQNDIGEVEVKTLDMLYDIFVGK